MKHTCVLSLISDFCFFYFLYYCVILPEFMEEPFHFSHGSCVGWMIAILHCGDYSSHDIVPVSRRYGLNKWAVSKRFLLCSGAGVKFQGYCVLQPSVKDRYMGVSLNVPCVMYIVFCVTSNGNTSHLCEWIRIRHKGFRENWLMWMIVLLYSLK